MILQQQPYGRLEKLDLLTLTCGCSMSNVFRPFPNVGNILLLIIIGPTKPGSARFPNIYNYTTQADAVHTFNHSDDNK